MTDLEMDLKIATKRAEDTERKLRELEAWIEKAKEALEEIVARCELNRCEDDIHVDNYYEAKTILSTTPAATLEEWERALRLACKFIDRIDNCHGCPIQMIGELKVCDSKTSCQECLFDYFKSEAVKER